jgi:hypothetical protein
MKEICNFRCREGRLNVEATFQPWPGGEGGAVSLGDGADDGKAEAGALPVVGSICARALKGPKEALDIFRRDGRTIVGHLDEGASRPQPRSHLNPPSHHIVPEGVVDEVGNEALCQT